MITLDNGKKATERGKKCKHDFERGWIFKMLVKFGVSYQDNAYFLITYSGASFRDKEP